MEDSQIVELYWQRDETALSATADKYGRYCFSIANGILHNAEDARECVNDTYLGAWNAIPPHRPAVLSTFLGKITRRLSLKKHRDMTTAKRGGTSVDASLEELAELIPGEGDVGAGIEQEELSRIIRSFLETLPQDERRVFVRRYWFIDSISDISSRFGFSESKVKSMLKRSRDKLAARLTREGIWV